MKKLIFILLDGLTAEAGQRNLGYLEHLVANNQAARYSVKGELPSLSRPMYETIFTGLPVYQHGVLTNDTVRLSKCTSIFDLCQDIGLSSLAIGYHWISELYLKAPFNPLSDCLHSDSQTKIQHGFFYYEDTFPDSHLYSLANTMISRYESDFVFIHPMNIDDAGHKFGCNSQQYHGAVAKNNNYIATLLQAVEYKGYSVIVASDHGMNELGLHGGDESSQRNSYMYIIDDEVVNGVSDIELSTLQYAPLMAKILDLNGLDCYEELKVKFYEK